MLFYVGLFVLMLGLNGYGLWLDLRKPTAHRDGGDRPDRPAASMPGDGRPGSGSMVTVQAHGPSRRLGRAGPAHLTVRGFRPGIDRLRLEYAGPVPPQLVSQQRGPQGLSVQLSDGSDILFLGVADLPVDALELCRDR